MGQGQGQAHVQSVIGRVEVEDVLRFQHKRIVTNLFKGFLVILEDLTMEHDRAMQKLSETLPAEYRKHVYLADYLDEEKGEVLRSKVLTLGNDTIRALDEQLVNYDIAIKSGRGNIL